MDVLDRPAGAFGNFTPSLASQKRVNPRGVGFSCRRNETTSSTEAVFFFDLLRLLLQYEDWLGQLRLRKLSSVAL